MATAWRNAWGPAWGAAWGRVTATAPETPHGPGNAAGTSGGRLHGLHYTQPRPRIRQLPDGTTQLLTPSAARQARRADDELLLILHKP